MILSDRERTVLRVALGLDGNDVPRRDAAEIAFKDGSDDDAMCQSLMERGVLEPAPRSELFPDFNPYRITPVGRARFVAFSQEASASEMDRQLTTELA